MPYFFCRLLPPRPTFAQDMSPAEGQLMQLHGAYWRALAEKGVAVLFGPVGDPAGAWGLGILEVDDEDDVRTLTADDPVIKSRLGFKYETFPILRTTVRNSLERHT